MLFFAALLRANLTSDFLTDTDFQQPNDTIEFL
jgi:hypothetical protein